MADQPQRKRSLVSIHFDAGNAEAGVTTTADLFASSLSVHLRAGRVTISAGGRARISLPRSVAEQLRDKLARELPPR